VDPFRSTYEVQHDTFKHVQFAILPCVVLSLCFHEGNWAKQSLSHYIFEMCVAPSAGASTLLAAACATDSCAACSQHRRSSKPEFPCNPTTRTIPHTPLPSHSLWAFSIWLEAIAIVPQLILLQRHKCVENITSWYVFSLGAYRGLYIVNWVYRYFTEPHYRSWIAWIAGTVQTLFYADFFYYFALCKVRVCAGRAQGGRH